jgi:hypothetical protein
MRIPLETVISEKHITVHGVTQVFCPAPEIYLTQAQKELL